MRFTYMIPVAACVAAFSAPALAQDATPAEQLANEPPPAGATSTTMTPDQQAAHDSWPAEQQAKFASLPPETQSYFWTLPPQRQEVFWRLSDNDRVALSKVPPAQQEQVWGTIEQQIAGQVAPPPPGDAAQPVEAEAEPRS